MPHQDEQTTTISAKTKFPLELVITLCVGIAAGCAAWYSLKAQLSDLGNTMREIKAEQRSFWTRQEQAEWTWALDKANPEIDVPVVSARNATASAK